MNSHESTFAAMKDTYGKSTATNTAKSFEDIKGAKSIRGDFSCSEDQVDELRE